jgi:shikimate dehydrogenase
MTDAAGLKLGLIGFPVGHSLSPLLQNDLLNAIRITGTYELYETPRDQLQTKVAALKAAGLRGFNVTIPFKQEIIPLLDQIDEVAQLAGAVNTVVLKKNKLYGFNTDKPGFDRTLLFHGIKPSKLRAMILGAGGAARAVVLSLIQSGVRKIYVANRTTSRAISLVEDISKSTGFFNFITMPLSQKSVGGLIEEIDIMVNTTSVGMWPTQMGSPFEFSKSSEQLVAVDLVYNPLETRFLKSARKSGVVAIDGLDLFIYQGIAAMEIWTAKKINGEAVYPNLRKKLSEALQNYGTT